ncbi:MAG: histidinol-phosphate transaminase [Gemmatimonadota bacterium]
MTSLDIARASLRDVPTYAPDLPSCPIDLRDNTSLFGAPPAALAAVRAMESGALTEYPDVAGGRLTRALAGKFGIRPEEIVTGCGSDDVLDAAFRAVAEPGAVLAHPSPSFSMVPVFARLNSLVPVAVPLTRTGAADADAMLATGARIIYLCSPNNPTGTVTPADVVRRIVRESGAIVILDGAYAEFSPELDDLRVEAPALERLLVVRTFSKAWGLAGLRVGYGVGSAALVREVQKARGPYKLNAAAERAAVTALAQDDEWMRRHAAEAVDCRERAVVALRDLGLFPLDSRGNFVCVPVPDALAVARQLAFRGVAVRAFSALPVFGDVLRVGMAPWPVVERFVRALREVLA